MLDFTIAVSFLLCKYVDVDLISGLMLFNAIIRFIRERRATKTLTALKGDVQIAVSILRNKKWQQIAGSQVVPGDIVRFRKGDMITADAKLIDGMAGADQSALSGESKLNNKKTGDIVYAGSVIKNGECNAVIIATGVNTFSGKTAQLV